MQLKPLKRFVFTAVPKEANLPGNVVLEVILPHYGLVKSSSCFFESYHSVFTNKLKIRFAPLDPCFLFQTETNGVSFVVRLATDDSINKSNEAYKNCEAEATLSFINIKKTSFLMRFLGYILTEDTNTILMSQDEHIKHLTLFYTTIVNLDLFKIFCSQLLSISQRSRPIIAYDVAQLCQVKVEDINKRETQAIYKTIQYLKESTELKIRYHSLNQDSLKLYVFVDSIHNTNCDKTS